MFEYVELILQKMPQSDSRHWVYYSEKTGSKGKIMGDSWGKVEILNELGEQGWEVISTLGEHFPVYFLLMREVAK